MWTLDIGQWTLQWALQCRACTLWNSSKRGHIHSLSQSWGERCEAEYRLEVGSLHYTIAQLHYCTIALHLQCIIVLADKYDLLSNLICAPTNIRLVAFSNSSLSTSSSSTSLSYSYLSFFLVSTIADDRAVRLTAVHYTAPLHCSALLRL